LSTFCSVFQQILKLFPRADFAEMVQRHRAERHARGFSSWQQFVAMLFCHLGRAQSLREICDGLRSIDGKLRHLGIASPKRSTLAYANEHRPWQLFESVFHRVLSTIRGDLGEKHRFRFKNPLLSLDSTLIELCIEVFDWAKYKTQKGAIKLHMLLDHAGHLPTFCDLTDGSVHDIQVARRLHLPRGTIIVFDRGYVDYEWFRSLTQRGVWFVTRLRRNINFEVVERRLVRGNVLTDEVIDLKKHRTYAFTPLRLRHVVAVIDDDGTIMEFFTNNLHLAASTIAAIYKQRWQIETFFKALKQNLRIKSFIGTSANAVAIQVWTALIAILILKYMQLKARRGWSLSHLTALLRMHLFSYRDLWAWLDDPFASSDLHPNGQLGFEFG
jgi:hypothetical protein